ncbi:MAG: hypothetical protein JWR05_537 [Mucilaginibacter sp.]|nr:hypothetical protein [Mucilaginibacter sp.]
MEPNQSDYFVYKQDTPDGVGLFSTETCSGFHRNFLFIEKSKNFKAPSKPPYHQMLSPPD